MGDYKSLLEVEDQKYTTVSWDSIHDNIESILAKLDTRNDEPTNRSDFLASQFTQYLETHGLKLSESESRYSSGQKYISLRFQPDMKVVTPEAESLSPEYAAHFHSLPENDGIDDFHISQGELETLLENLEERHPELRSALQHGDFDPFDDFANNHDVTEGDTKVIAEIGEQNVGRKRLQVAQPQDRDYRVLGFRRASPDSTQYSPGAYYMLSAGEFESHFSSRDGEGVSVIGQALFGKNPDIMNLQ